MSDSESAVFRIVIESTLDEVWQELTRTDGLQRAMFNSRMDTRGLEPGNKLCMRTPNGRFTSVVGTFLEVEQPVRLAHTMRFTSYDDPEATVVYDLREVEGGVELTLTVSEMTPGTKSTKQMKQGGTFIVKNLKAIVETGRPTLGARLLFVVFKLMGPLTPKRLRSENWPR